MASSIILRTISGTDDKRVSLANSNFARPFTIASGWTTLRIALRMIANNNGANITGTPRFYVGLCSGSSNIIMDATTTHWAGAIQNAATLTYAAGPPARYTGTVVRPAKRVAAVLTVGGSDIHSAGTAGYHCDPTQAQRFLFFCDITVGSPNYTFNVYTLISPTVSGDITLTQFNDLCQLTLPVVGNHGFGSARTLAVDPGADGALNHVNIGWDRSVPTLEICDIALVKLA